MDDANTNPVDPALDPMVDETEEGVEILPSESEEVVEGSDDENAE